MLRSSRLIDKTLKAPPVYNILKKQDGGYKANWVYNLNVRPGDIMTGWERIASMPLSDQELQKVYDFLRGESKNIGWIEWCCRKYRWNGTKWEAID
jgi:hypothetical protein